MLILVVREYEEDLLGSYPPHGYTHTTLTVQEALRDKLSCLEFRGSFVPAVFWISQIPLRVFRELYAITRGTHVRPKPFNAPLLPSQLRLHVLAEADFLLTMKLADHPRVSSLALPALRIPTKWQWTHANAVWTAHLATTSSMRALNEGTGFSTIGKETVYSLNLLHRFILHVLLPFWRCERTFWCLQSSHRSVVCTAGLSAAAAQFLRADYTFQVSSLPAASCGRVAWIRVTRTPLWTCCAVSSTEILDLPQVSLLPSVAERKSIDETVILTSA